MDVGIGVWVCSIITSFNKRISQPSTKEISTQKLTNDGVELGSEFSYSISIEIRSKWIPNYWLKQLELNSHIVYPTISTEIFNFNKLKINFDWIFWYWMRDFRSRNSFVHSKICGSLQCIYSFRRNSFWKYSIPVVLRI